ncbi:hypothetical protein BDZ94DRAFT_1278426 [Collybia nuda]|uniref:Uncharacterized protein n=1 Tax=Collybia nuda TaxID=64659 RepID=A0A9P6CBP1_9AGAR|nr:hypothetical protein BDZ94DRAFT_1278426 [Collybia nuda]
MGQLPRLNLWVLLIITKVMPDYFQQLRDQQSQQQYYAAMRKAPSCYAIMLVVRLNV